MSAAPETLALIEEVRRLDKAATPGPWDLALAAIRSPETMAATARVVESGGAELDREPLTSDLALMARYRTLAPKLADALEAADAALREERQNAAREREEWQDASGLCVPAEEAGGDPGGVTPRHLAEYVHGLVKEAEGLRGRLAEAEANHEGALKAAAYWKDRHGAAEARAKAAEERIAVLGKALADAPGEGLVTEPEPSPETPPDTDLMEMLKSSLRKSKEGRRFLRGQL